MWAPVFVCEGRFEARFATELVTGFSDSVVPPAGCPRAAGAARFRCVAPLLACCAGKRFAFPQLRTLSGSNPGITVAKSPSPRGQRASQFKWCPQRDVRVRLAPPAFAASLRSLRAALENACAFPQLRTLPGSNPGVGEEKKPVTARVTGFAFQMVPPAGFEPAISTLKGWRPWPLDDGDSGKEYSRLFCRRVYRWQTGKPPQRCLSPLW